MLHLWGRFFKGSAILTLGQFLFFSSKLTNNSITIHIEAETLDCCIWVIICMEYNTMHLKHYQCGTSCLLEYLLYSKFGFNSKKANIQIQSSQPLIVFCNSFQRCLISCLKTCFQKYSATPCLLLRIKKERPDTVLAVPVLTVVTAVYSMLTL